MQVPGSLEIDWRDEAAYDALFRADRSLLAWEWLRRDPSYRAIASGLGTGGRVGSSDASAAGFGLVRFENPDLGLSDARPLWLSSCYASVLEVGRARSNGGSEDMLDLQRFADLATIVSTAVGEHLLLSDGLEAIRLDAPPGLFSSGAFIPAFRIVGIASGAPVALTLQRLLALCRTGRFARSLHPRKARTRRLILMLRAWDGLAAGANQREIAEVLLARGAREGRWRSQDPSLRSRAQRLVRSSRQLASGGYRALLS